MCVAPACYRGFFLRYLKKVVGLCLVVLLEYFYEKKLKIVINSDFGFETTFEIVKKIQLAFNEVLEEINSLAKKNPLRKHYFEAEIVGISIYSEENKPYRLGNLVIVLKGALFVDEGDGFKIFDKQREETFSHFIGVSPKHFENELKPPKWSIMSLSDVLNIYLKAFIRHFYKDDIFCYLNRNNEEFF